MHERRMKPPKTRRRFASVAGELDYARQKMTYWLHMSNSRRNAARYVSRIKRLLEQAGNMGIAIISPASQAVVAEYERKWKQAFAFRQREVRLIVRLYRSFTADQTKDLQDFALQGRHPHEMDRYLRALRKTYELAGAQEIANQFSVLQREIRHGAGFLK